MKPWLLRFHRWVALVFAIPLLVVIATGLLLAIEPLIVMGSVKPGSLTAEKVVQLIARHDPQGQARVLTHRAYEQSLTISTGRGGGIRVDTMSGDVKAVPGSLSELLATTRRLHESLLLDATWLVISSTFAMLVLAVLGVAMGWPRIANSLAGWHKALAFGLLPLLVLSPLTGLFIAFGITFVPLPQAAATSGSPPMKLIDAVRVAGARHDLSRLVWLRPQGGRTAMRIIEDGEYRVYAVTPAGTTRLPRNWPRLWHEGNFAGMASTIPNLAISLAALGLLLTGVWIWTRRQLRLRSRRAVA